MTIQELFIRSNQELQKVINQIKDDQWSIQMPEGLTTNPTTLRQAVAYHAYDDAWVPDILDGKTADQVGDRFEAILNLKDPTHDFATYSALAIASVQGFTDLTKTTHLSYGDFPARDYLQHITSFRGLRVYDIAKLIGADTTMADDFVQGMWDEFSPIAEDYRQMGVFPAAIEVAENADLQTRFLALVGRT